MGGARIWRINADETISLVVEHAGSATEIVYAPTGRRLRRRAYRPFRLAGPACDAGPSRVYATAAG